MSIGITDLSQDVLTHIFSYLPPGDLGKTSRVCQNWNKLSTSLWQNSAQSMLDLQEPMHGSWKEECKILHRWTTWKPKEISLSPPSPWARINNLCKPLFYILLEDASVYEAIREDPSRPSRFSLRNLFDHKKLSQIDMAKYVTSHDYINTMHGVNWAISEKNGHICQFDITTGTCLNQFNGETAHPGDTSVLYCNENEIISSVNNRVQMWDLQQCQLSQTFTIEEPFKIINICSTPGLVLCLANDSGNMSIFAVNKKDPTIQSQIEVGWKVSPNSFKSSGSFCVLVGEKGKELQIYEETSGAQFKLARSICFHDTSGPVAKTMQLYRNWVYGNIDGRFWIVDVRTGREILSLKHDWGTEARFQINSQALLVFRFMGKVYRHLTLYDFQGEAHLKSSSGSWCSIV